MSAMSTGNRGMVWRLLAGIAFAALLGAVSLAADSRVAEAQTEPSTTTPTATATPLPGDPMTPLERQALAIEHQLLCPLCTNERLDVCSLAVCMDMKRLIRERLEAGSTPDDIILHFETRYGPKVRAALPPTGFNLLLFGWVGGALLLTTAAATLTLASMRRASTRKRATEASPPAATPDDGWLDAQIHDEEAGPRPPNG